jgi:hypothetical protein
VLGRERGGFAADDGLTVDRCLEAGAVRQKHSYGEVVIQRLEYNAKLDSGCHQDDPATTLPIGRFLKPLWSTSEVDIPPHLGIFLIHVIKVHQPIETSTPGT